MKNPKNPKKHQNFTVYRTAQRTLVQYTSLDGLKQIRCLYLQEYFTRVMSVPENCPRPTILKYTRKSLMFIYELNVLYHIIACHELVLLLHLNNNKIFFIHI